MRHKNMLKITFILALASLAVGGLMVAPTPASALPTWYTPTPQPPAQPQPKVGVIELTAPAAPTGAWTIVQWQGAAGVWNDVTGWEGPLDLNGKIHWIVDPADFNHGPFRWLVYEKLGGPIWGASANFTLPDRPQAWTSITVSPATTAALAPTTAISTSRLHFSPGTTTVNATASLQPGQTQSYTLKASQGQLMRVELSSPNNDVTLSLAAPNGAALVSASDKQSTWQGKLPATGDYTLAIHSGAASDNFNLNVTIAARLQFARGTQGATLTGKAVGGYPVTFVVAALKGQKLSVDLSSSETNAVLAVWGVTDGQPYLGEAAGQVSFSLTLPSTQDYLLIVVPKAGPLVTYTLAVKINH
jgi:hypothetical protein